MGRGAVFEGVEEKAKLRFDFFGAKSEEAEHLHLHSAVVYTDRSTSNFCTVDDQVVGVGFDAKVVAVIGAIEQW